jgi:hypothetical protein
MQTHTRARACADADVRRCTHARAWADADADTDAKHARVHSAHEHAHADASPDACARRRCRRTRAHAQTQTQMHSHADADADSDARALIETASDSRSMRLTGLLTTQSGEKTSSSNGSGVQLGGRHGIGIIFNGGLAVFKRARRFAIGCLCGSRILATLRIPPPCHWQHSIENLVQETLPSPKLLALGIGVYEGFFAPVHRCTGTPRGLTHRDTDTSSVARSPINRNIDCRVRTDTPIPIGTTAKQCKHIKHGRIPRQRRISAGGVESPRDYPISNQTGYQETEMDGLGWNSQLDSLKGLGIAPPFQSFQRHLPINQQLSANAPETTLSYIFDASSWEFSLKT